MRQPISVNQDNIREAFTMKERDQLCTQLDCSLKELVYAEYEVGIANPSQVMEYLKNKKKRNGI